MTKTELSGKNVTKSVLVDMVVALQTKFDAQEEYVHGIEKQLSDEQELIKSLTEQHDAQLDTITELKAVVVASGEEVAKLHQQLKAKDGIIAEMRGALDSIEVSDDTTDSTGMPTAREQDDGTLDGENIAELCKRLRIKPESALWDELNCNRDHDRFSVWFPNSVYGGTDPAGHKRISQQCYEFLGRLRAMASKRGAGRAYFERDHLVIVVRGNLAKPAPV